MSHEQLRHNCEYHRGVACMVNADEVLKILDELDRLQAVVAAAQRLAAPSMLDDVTLATSAFENYGQHHGWCAGPSTQDRKCTCGYERMLDELHARRQAAEMATQAIAALAAEKEARELAERRNVLNPSATEYVTELEAERDGWIERANETECARHAAAATLEARNREVERLRRVVDPLIREAGVLDRAHRATVEYELDNDVAVLLWPLLREARDALEALAATPPPTPTSEDHEN